MYNKEVIKWFLDQQEVNTLKSILSRFAVAITSNEREDVTNAVFSALSNVNKHSGFETQRAYEDLKKEIGLVDYVWCVLCDLALDYNVQIIKAFIGYVAEDTTVLSENNKLLREKVKSLEKQLNELAVVKQQLTKEKGDLITQKDVQKKLLRENEAKIKEQEEILNNLSAHCASLKNTIENLSAQNSYLRNRKSYTSEVINYEDDGQVFSAFENNAKACSLNFNSNDLINFYTSVKSSRLTIIEGISGTGKSKLVDLYGQTLGLDKDNRMLVIPVSPGWTDDSDILGYLDTNSMTYKEASIGLVSFLVEAEKHPDKPYLISFDEMNLAKVEYYFAKFISVLENDVNNRILRIYNPREEKDVLNYVDYPAEIRLGENLIFCGTINVDESTYRLSDKVLDRANLIKLQDCDFGVYDDEKPVFKVVDVTLVDRPIEGKLTDDELSILDELNERLKAINPRFGFAHRVIRQIGRYLEAIPENSIDFTREKALDKLIVQKILPKVRGTEEQVRDLLGYVENNNYIPGIIDEFLNDEPSKVTYTAVRKALKEKAKELKNYGYIG